MDDVTGAEAELLESRVAELELQLAEQSWERLATLGDGELSRSSLLEIADWARVMYLKNPLVRRGVNVQKLYVFGQGVQVGARDPAVNAVVQAFWDDAQNQVELTGRQALELKEVDLAIEGDQFFVLFVNRATGRVRVRTIQPKEIVEIVCDPEDGKAPWYYKRVWVEERLDLGTGVSTGMTRTAYYPDWLYAPKQKPGTIGGAPVLWETPVYHVKVGGLSWMRFGVSEAYAAIDWARAYKAFLEDWATLTRAYSRFAHKLTVPGGKAGIAAAKTKLGTTLGLNSGETNPPPTVGSTFIGQQGVDLQAMRIGGANVSAEDGRRLLLMVAAAWGLPESFFGDVSVGTLATAKSLDRPTELQMLSRQGLWAETFQSILRFVITWAVRAPGGPLEGQISDEEDGTPRVQVFVDGEEVDATVDVLFPPILEHDTDALIRGIVSAATLDGKTLAGTVDARTVSRLLLNALGVKDIDAVLGVLFPEGSGDPSTAAAASAQDDNGGSEVAEAVRGLREAVLRFVARIEQDGQDG